eukprot:14594548-Alexandrium_andersonii.AAC.1
MPCEPVVEGDWERLEAWESAQPAVAPAALIVGGGAQAGACARGLIGEAIRHAVRCRAVVGHV